MIYEMRTYQVQPGKAGEFLKLYQEQGLHIITPLRQAHWLLDQGVGRAQFGGVRLGLR